MAVLLSGKEVAASLDDRLFKRVERLKAQGVHPALAILRVGARQDDLAYERSAVRRCEKLGIGVQSCQLDTDCTQAQLLAEIERINRDDSIHGCILLRPLPPDLDERAACQALRPEKDVDCITDGSLVRVFTGYGAGYPPCAAEACMEILKHYHCDLRGRNAVVVGRSLVVGKPAAMLLLAENATVTLCHTGTLDLAEKCRRADILVVATGQIGTVDARCVAPGQTIIDVGIHVKADGSMCGDVDFGAAEPVAAAITPVPGGVGSVTTSVLLRHVVESAAAAGGFADNT